MALKRSDSDSGSTVSVTHKSKNTSAASNKPNPGQEALTNQDQKPSAASAPAPPKSESPDPDQDERTELETEIAELHAEIEKLDARKAYLMKAKDIVKGIEEAAQNVFTEFSVNPAEHESELRGAAAERDRLNKTGKQ